MAGRLQNALAEMCVVVGLDENTGLQPFKPQPSGPSHEEQLLYKSAFEPQVLAAVSSHLAVFPFSQPKQDPHYPPSALGTPIIVTRNHHLGSPKLNGDVPHKSDKKPTRRLGRFRRHSNKEIKSSSELSSSPIRGGFLSLKPNRNYRITRKNSVTAVDFVRRDDRHSVSIGPKELPVSFDVINSLGTFCFPDYAYVQRYRPDDHVHFLVLTDISGTRSYAACITFFRPFIVEQEEDDEESWRCMLWPKMAAAPELAQGQMLCYLPSCVVVISKHPYFTVLKDCLSRLVQKVRQNPEDLSFYVKEFALQVTMTPAPPAGRLALQFIMDQVVFTLNPPDHPERPVVDVPLNLIFQCFSVDQILQLLTCILTQQKILFVASSYALLTIIMESLLTFIMPFKWSATYVPVLSQKLVELIDAPGYYLMGCHSSYRQQAHQVQGLVVADIDHGEVCISGLLDIPSMPRGPAALFETAYCKSKHQLDVVMLECPTTFMYEDTKKLRDQFLNHFNHEILSACLHLMVNLFRDVIQFIKVEKRFFNKEQFMEVVDPADKHFYEQVFQTELFSRFLRDRFAQKTDYWTALEEKTRPQPRNSLGDRIERSGNSRPHVQPSRSNLSTGCNQRLQLEYMQLPNFLSDNHGQFYEKCEQEFTDQMQEKKSTSLRASYLYLRGIMKAAQGNGLQGLEDFHSLWTYDKRLFPLKMVTELLNSLSDTEKDQLSKMAFYKKSEEWHQVNLERQSSLNQPIIMELEKIPSSDVNEETFKEHVQLLEIVAYPDTITRLFEALTLKQTHVVEPSTFEVFYECWKELEMQCRELVLPDNYDYNEWTLKISDLIKTSYGTGRLVLTQKRLLFLSEGSKNWREIMKLSNLKRVDKVMELSFLTKVPALKLISEVANAPVFIAWLKGAQHAWYICIQEMVAGKHIAAEVRDPGVMQQAAMNVRLINAVLKSGQEVCCFHHTSPEVAAQYLCHFTVRQEEGNDTLPPATKDLLQHRVDPNVSESERRAVEALLYSPGNQSLSAFEGHGPSLWCGMGSGKLVVFDASTWIIKHQIPEAREKIVCLLAVGKNQIWAGSFDAVIYVIDSLSKECRHTLMEHTDMITGLAWFEEHGLVFSASLNGQIIAWDQDTLQSRNTVKLKGINSLKTLQFINGQLWCCTRQELRVLSISGSELKKISYVDHAAVPPVQLDCFIVTPQKEVWLGCGKQGEVHVYDAETFQLKQHVPVPCRGISKMIHFHNKVWVGSKDGSIFILNADTYRMERHLEAHEDSIRAMCVAEDRYLMSGAGSLDGRIYIWRNSFDLHIADPPRPTTTTAEYKAAHAKPDIYYD